MQERTKIYVYLLLIKRVYCVKISHAKGDERVKSHIGDILFNTFCVVACGRSSFAGYLFFVNFYSVFTLGNFIGTSFEFPTFICSINLSATMPKYFIVNLLEIDTDK